MPADKMILYDDIVPVQIVPQSSDQGEFYDEDYDGFYEYDDIASITTSLSTSATDYKFENGRRYHGYKEGQWPVPNDEKQQNQMDLVHQVYTLRLGGKLYLAPIDECPQKILDVGTGTGIWAMEMGDLHPSAVVIGNDLSPIQPRWVPPNVKFEIDDFNEPWVQTPSSYDFVHAREIHGAVSDWRQFCSEAFRILKPGGWIEVAESAAELRSDDGTLPKDCALNTWLNNVSEGFERIGHTVVVGPNIESWLREAGFEEITVKVFKLPVGLWPKNKVERDIGAFNLLNMIEYVEGASLQIYTRVLKKSLEETRRAIRSAQAEFKRKDYHMYVPYYVAYARKPDPST
ncbi:hypothetical protein TWF569_001393 [Orbilia oligospora]|uniref:S-adenosyl-L-methionine-dependent methyltransferase n=1 Tax=Orbilia oligospora TaxID=2813651 RepID=A0A7C8P5Y2_ORBOL|nr:hypothetical protein TWF102_000576 [Orbilia oligospora]KAF3091788.1 hypothetical protein TWF706_009462 [Orbilia oligospora]KAF3117433.1 hypothetical protein TWF103_006176 [Orbilia oligospora]KAF3133895.1 hypothetical protein TWF703_006609 [Orbilia oligospora]KAF3146979.1 hypothetical protein TWF594_003031 [Orbilia oligospora]